jgi:hypothetical protein
MLQPFWHWLAHVTGGDNGGGAWYLELSGFAGDITLFASMFTIAYALLRKHNCHTKGCWRLGLRPTAAGDYVCHKHHPEGKLTHADIIARHEAALGKEPAT